MTIDTTVSLTISEFIELINSMSQTSLSGYESVYLCSNTYCVDLYGERLENDEEYRHRVELEEEYKRELESL